VLRLAICRGTIHEARRAWHQVTTFRYFRTTGLIDAGSGAAREIAKVTRAVHVLDRFLAWFSTAPPGGCEAAEGTRKPEAVERRFVIRSADARQHAGCNSRDTIGAASIAMTRSRTHPKRVSQMAPHLHTPASLSFEALERFPTMHFPIQKMNHSGLCCVLIGTVQRSDKRMRLAHRVGEEAAIR
jgi:hypothetical protein